MFTEFLQSRTLRLWFTRLFLLLIFLVILIGQARTYVNGGSPYQTADWLINYSGGFVRRGLFGELFLSLPLDGTTGIWVLFSIQLFMYSCFLVFGYLMIRRSQFSWLSIAIWLAPSTLGFFAWDSSSPFRKEILGYLVLACLVALRGELSRKLQDTVSIAAVIAFALAIFSWEASALFLPIITFLIWTNPIWKNDKLRRIIYSLLFIGLGFSGAVVSIFYHGDAATAVEICERVRDKGYEAANLCSGAIDAIGWPSSYTLNKVVVSFPLYLGYAILAPFAVAPIILALRREPRKLWIAVIIISYLPLFVIVNDYGRWISMVAISLAFMTTTIKHQQPVAIYWFPYLAIAYLTLWGMPHWLEASSDSWPWLGLLATVLKLVQLF